MYRIATIKEIESYNLDLRKIPLFIFDHLGDTVAWTEKGYFIDNIKISADHTVYITSLTMPMRYVGEVRVINETEWNKQNNYSRPTDDLKAWFGISLSFNAHFRCDKNGNFWYWQSSQNTPSFISAKFIIHTIPTTVDATEFKHTVAGDTTYFLNTRTKLPEGMMVKNMKEDFFNLKTEEETKINLNLDYSYVFNQDFAGYKKGEIISSAKYDMMTGDPIIIDLQTGKEVILHYGQYQSRSNQEYLKMRQDN